MKWFSVTGAFAATSSYLVALFVFFATATIRNCGYDDPNLFGWFITGTLVFAIFWLPTLPIAFVVGGFVAARLQANRPRTWLIASAILIVIAIAAPLLTTHEAPSHCVV